jgi:hypothetical protein
MNTRYHVIKYLMAAALLAAPWQISTAAPAMKESPKSQNPAKPMASKPKLAPRPVPGTSGSANAVASASAPVTVRRTPAAAPAAHAAPAADQARIIMIYRSGTFEPLPPDPAPEEPKGLDDKSTGEAQPAPVPLPGPGEVRIISKAQADALAAQPHN